MDEQQEGNIQPQEEAQPAVADYEFDLQVDESAKAVTKQMLWERKLLDFSLRNNLLNTRLGRRVVPFVSFEIEHLEDHLQAGEDYNLMPTPDVKLEPGCNGMYHSASQAPQYREQVEQAIGNHRIITYLTEAELQTALKYLYRTSRTQMEENGANSLFLVLGVLRWFENERTEQPRFAPLLMLPVDMVRHGVNNYVVRAREEETVLNITLVEFLKHFFKINLDFLSPLPTDGQGVDVRRVLDAVRKAIEPMKRWTVMEESMMGLFSFNKFVMWNDIHTHADLLAQNPIVASLIEGRIMWDDSGQLVDAREIDKQNQPQDFAIPMDVDSSQMEAVVESGKGRSFILYGPPGTGKSQTITNMIANALYQGRRVLFVAEKMAALEVVQERLTKIGLDAFCLELHSNKVTKRHFLAQMKKALDARHLARPDDYADLSQRLYQERQKLISNMEALHRKQPNGLSLYDCISGYLAIETSGLPFRLPDGKTVTKADLQQWQDEVKPLEAVLQVSGHPHNHPLAGLDPKELLHSTSERLEQLLTTYQKQYQTMAKCRQALSAVWPLPMDMLSDYEWIEQLASRLADVEDVAFLSANVKQLKEHWEAVNAKPFLTRFFARRSFLKEMRQYGHFDKHNVTANLTNLEGIRDLEADYAKAHDLLTSQVTDAVRALTPDGVKAIVQMAEACHLLNNTNDALRRETELSVKEDGAYYDNLNRQATVWLTNLSQLRNWQFWIDKKRELCATNARCIVDMLESEDVTPAEAVRRQTKGMYHRLALDMVLDDPQLRRFNGVVFESIISQYVADTNYFQRLSRRELYGRLVASIPSQTMAAVASSEMGFLKRNIMNGGRGMSIRAIIDHIPTLLPRLCPCMLMSPISVAQYLDLNADKFDLVIFDEASQMPTSEAIGAIARGRALIVVGDPKQMPPTSFFTTSQTDEDEVAIDDMESILDDCIALSVPAHHLAWHYRSRHESLIAFSNQQYYDGALMTFPSVDDRQSKVTLVPVESAYDRGHTRSNPNEARAIVDEVLRRLADRQLSRQSIGIVSFSKAQQNLIEDLLTDELAAHPRLEAVANRQAEPIFVKNLENVQGDERDVILFSVGYGPDRSGHLSMNFGPLNNAGGERRLNVAVSRARHEMVVYSSLTPEQIDLSRSKAKGVEGLRNFLKYAECGRLPRVDTTAASPYDMPATASPLAMQIVGLLREHGYEADANVGRSSFKVDVAVVDRREPSRYMLGILCDGPNYYETKTVSDRDVVQPSVLHGLSWNTMRVWSIDWYTNRDLIADKILKRLADIEAHPTVQPSEDDDDDQLPPATETHVAEPPQAQEPEEPLHAEYQEADLARIPISHLPPEGQIKELVRVVLLTEQPVTEDYICKRVARQLGKSPRGTNLKRNVEYTLANIGFRHPLPEDVPAVWWAHEKRSRIYQGYRTAGPRDPADLPMPEVMNAVNYVVEQQSSLPTDVLKRLVALAFGYARRNQKIDAVTMSAVQLLVGQGRLSESADMVSLKT